MREWIGIASPAVAVLLAVAGGCGGTGRREEFRQQLFRQIALKFERFNAALLESDEQRISSIRSEMSGLVQANFDDVVAGLSSEDPQRQSDAAFALAFSRNPAAVEPLVAAARSPVVQVRANAAASLGMLELEEVPAATFAELLKDPEPSVRLGALFGLRFLLNEKKDMGLLGEIHAKLSDPAAVVRNDAVILLRKLRREESAAKIIEFSVGDGDPLVRANAAVTLGVLGSKAATPVLIEMLRDDHTKVVESAWLVLKTIHKKDLDRSYSSWREWYEEEIRHHYSCPEHKEVSRPEPGECPVCKSQLERMPIEQVKKPDKEMGFYACPSHPEVVTSTPGRCGKAGCGKELVPIKPERILYTCPEHHEILTTSPSRCGKCGKDLVPWVGERTVYGCPVHPEVVTTSPARCGKPGCGRELVPVK